MSWAKGDEQVLAVADEPRDALWAVCWGQCAANKGEALCMVNLKLIRWSKEVDNTMQCLTHIWTQDNSNYAREFWSYY